MKLHSVDKRCSSIIKYNELGYLSKEDRYDNPTGKTAIKKNTWKKIKAFFGPFVNLGIGTSALELELELELELILQIPLFPVP